MAANISNKIKFYNKNVFPFFFGENAMEKYLHILHTITLEDFSRTKICIETFYCVKKVQSTKILIKSNAYKVF